MTNFVQGDVVTLTFDQNDQHAATTTSSTFSSLIVNKI
jgi:hypothetical protein